MEWLNTDLIRMMKWEQERSALPLSLSSLIRSLWKQETQAVQPNLLILFYSLWDKEARDVQKGREQSDQLKLMFCVGLALGFVVGVGLIIFWVYCARLRSEERQEKAAHMASLSDMSLEDVRRLLPQDYFPYWIVMGEYEKVNWINQLVRKVWPLYTKSQSQFLKEIWEPWIDTYRPPSISQLSFSKFVLGSIPPVFLGVRMISASQDEIAMDTECHWQGNPSIILKVRTPLGLTFPIQIKNVTMLLVLRIIFRPLVNELPGFGAFTYSIRKNKRFDFTLKLIGGDITTIPALGNNVEEMIKASILDTLMWPMRIPVPVIPSPIDRDYSRLQRHFNPRRGAVLFSDYGTLEEQAVGILDVKLVQAKDLKVKNDGRKFNPYAFLYIKPIPRLMKRSKAITGKLYPIWNEVYEFEVDEPVIEKLVVKILDAEADLDAEMLGCCQVFLKDLEPGILDQKWVKLAKYLDREDVKYRGEVNLELVYRPYDHQLQLTSNPENSGITSGDTASTSRSGSPTASAFLDDDNKTYAGKAHALHPLYSYRGQMWEVVRGSLSVTVERAINLTAKDQFGIDPCVVLKMRNSKVRKQTKVAYKTLNPEWNQSLDFLSEDGMHEILQIKVWDYDAFGRELLGKCATTLTRAIIGGECRAELKLNAVPSGVIFLTMKWTSQPLRKITQRRLGVV